MPSFFFLLIYLVVFLIRPHEWYVLINENSSIIRDSLLACMALFVFAQHKNFNSPQFKLLIVLLIAVMVSHVLSGWVGGATIYGQEFVETVVIPFVLFSGLVSTIGRQYLIFYIGIGAAILMVFNGHVQISNGGLGYFGNSAVRDGSALRITYLGLLSDPNDLGMFLVMTMPAVFLLKEKAPSMLRPVLWGVAGILLYGVYLTNSRGTLLATIGLMFFWFWRKYGTNKSMWLGGVMSPILLLVMSQFRTISADDASSQGRLEAWYAGYQMFASNPLSGVGQHNFMDWYELHTAHNSFVLVMAELGFLGCAAWVGLLVVTTVSLFNISEKKFLPEGVEIDERKLEKIDGESLVAKSLLYSFVGYMVTGFFLSRTYTPLLYIYLGLGAACLGRVSRELPKGVKVFDGRKVTKWTLLGTLGSIFGIYILLKIFL